MPATADPLRIRFHQFGPPSEILRAEPLDLPPLEQGHLRIRMLAAPINPADLNFVEGVYGVKPELPATPGTEGCGEIVESRADGWDPGGRVILLGRLGSWSSLLDARPADLLRVPAGLDPVQAAMLKINPATAWLLLTGEGPLEPGSWVVQNAANSGVGRCLIQLARRLGIRTVNLVRRPDLEPELTQLGADIVLVDDDTAVQHALDAMGGRHAAVASNCVGGESALRLTNMLADRGTLITYGAMARRPLKIPNSLLIFRQLRFTGLWVSKWLESSPREEIEARYAELSELIDDGSLLQPIDSEFPLAKVREAVARAAEPGRDGKVILR